MARKRRLKVVEYTSKRLRKTISRDGKATERKVAKPIFSSYA